MTTAASPGRRPPALRAGDTVAVVSPAGPADPARVARGVALLEGWGLRVRLGRHALGRDGYFSAPDDDRLADLQDALDDPDVRAVFCTRGGYGVQRLVDRLDPARLREAPRVVVGFSDVTALHLALWRAADATGVHGPGAAWRAADDADGRAVARALHATLFTTADTVLTPDPAEPTAPVLVPGVARGTLLGGNLTLLAASVGTPDAPNLGRAILLVEDVAEAPYRVDRMLTQLVRSGTLAGVAGVAVGQFTGCVGPAGEPTVADVLAERLATLGVPVLGGLPVGHGRAPRSVPLGVPAVLDATAGHLTATAAVA